MQNCVDTRIHTAAISCTKDATRTLAWVAFGFRVPEVKQGKNRSTEEPSDGNQEEGKKEETLTNRLRDVLRKGQNLTSLSGEAPLERRFRFSYVQRTICAREILCIDLRLCHNTKRRLETSNSE
jgi:hypothetical protein